MNTLVPSDVTKYIKATIGSIFKSNEKTQLGTSKIGNTTEWQFRLVHKVMKRLDGPRRERHSARDTDSMKGVEFVVLRKLYFGLRNTNVRTSSKFKRFAEADWEEEIPTGRDEDIKINLAYFTATRYKLVSTPGVAECDALGYYVNTD